MSDVDYRLALARTAKLINEGKSLAEINRALLPRASRGLELRESRLKAADELLEAAESLLVSTSADQPLTGGWVAPNRSRLWYGLQLLLHAAGAYRRTVKEEEGFRYG